MPYKIVYHDTRQNQLLSCNVDGEAEVVYEPGTWTRPHRWLAELGYGLLYFDTLKSAQKFMYRSSFRPPLFQVWSCQARRVIHPLPVILLSSDLRDGKITHSGLPWEWPDGTKMAKQLMLEHQVK